MARSGKPVRRSCSPISTPIEEGPSTACAVSCARSGSRIAGWEGSQRTSVCSRPSASARASACFSAPAAPLPSTSTGAPHQLESRRRHTGGTGRASRIARGGRPTSGAQSCAASQ
eukprot:scaffold54513_cov31-Tisochrysis_lutea.AAC.4